MDSKAGAGQADVILVKAKLDNTPSTPWRTGQSQERLQWKTEITQMHHWMIIPACGHLSFQMLHRERKYTLQ